MKSTLLSLAVAAGFATAQLSDIPSCAGPCVRDYTSGNQIAGCGSLDFGCICDNSDFIQDVACCVVDVCSEEDRTRAVDIASGLCRSLGANIPDSIVCDNANATTTITAGPSGTGSSSDETETPDAAPGALNPAMGGVAAGALAVLFAL